MIQTFNVVSPITYSWTRRIHPWSWNHSSFYHISIRQNIGSRSLGITSGGDSVGQVSRIHPNMFFVQAPGRPHMGMGVHKARYDVISRCINNFCSRRDCNFIRFSQFLDAIVLNQNGSIFNDFSTLHRNQSSVSQC